MFSFNYYYPQITNGVFADYFTVLVRTGDADSGMFGLTMLVLEKSMKGINARQMKCSGVWPSGTALISFDNVAVPVANMVGDEGMGFKYAMTNFNRERMGICVQANRFARVCLEESMVHAQRRETFGKKLIDHPVIRNKLAHMARHVEATHALIELVAFQSKQMSDDEALTKLPGLISILKAQTSLTFELCAREAAQIFGGLAYTRGGLGEKVERLYREVRAYAVCESCIFVCMLLLSALCVNRVNLIFRWLASALLQIPGGSEEIMLDMGVRMAVKTAKDLKKELKEQAEEAAAAAKAKTAGKAKL